MQSSSSLMSWFFIICCHLRLVISFQHGRFAHLTEFRIENHDHPSKYHQKYSQRHQQTCLFGTKSEYHITKWNAKYQELAEFYKTHGHLRVEYGSSLCRWMGTQRQKRKGVEGYAPLTDEQIQLLDEINFAWDSEKGRRKGSSNGTLGWMRSYQEVAAFYKKHGHLRVEYKSSMYNWMAIQRRKRFVVGYAPLNDEQIQLLDEINFAWDSEKGRRKGSSNNGILGWMRSYHEVAAFYKKHGHLKVEYKSSIYNWMAIQRRKRFVEGYAPLPDEQIQLLDEINFAWASKRGPSNDEGWISKYQELAEFYKTHGHLRVEYGSSLYRWMGAQRQKRKGAKGRAPLTDEQIQLLDKINFAWNPRRKSKDCTTGEKYQ